MKTITEFRKLARDREALRVELTNLNNSLKSHPEKPENGQRPSPKYLDFRRTVHRDRSELMLDLNDIEAEIADFKDELGDTPLGLNSLADVIERLVQIELLFQPGEASEAWERLTEYVDTLEKHEDYLRAAGDAA